MTPGPQWHTRPITTGDLDTIVRHRRRMFEDMGLNDSAALDSADVHFRVWLTERFAHGEYVGWFAQVGDQVVAGSGIWLMQWVPSPRSPQGKRAYILNIYTEPDYRRQALARHLMGTILAWCQVQGYIGAILHASAEGRPLYESMGFALTNEMGILFDTPAKP